MLKTFFHGRFPEMQRPILWYFADPVCSRCRGFSPVIETLPHV
ncbi:MAG: hypothetical protein M0Z73_02725 [Betaproteobacteria bacterium]|nr:hypothetical protein [Betaproteobacteria bacterium]